MRSWKSGKPISRTANAALLVLAAAACTDPRARPVPPTMQIQVAPNLVVKSPGQIVGSFYLYDTNGLSSLDMRVHTPDTTVFAGDSLVPLSGDNSQTRPFYWTVPTGLASGTQIVLYGRALDFNSFGTSDSLVFTVQ